MAVSLFTHSKAMEKYAGKLLVRLGSLVLVFFFYNLFNEMLLTYFFFIVGSELNNLKVISNLFFLQFI